MTDTARTIHGTPAFLSSRKRKLTRGSSRKLSVTKGQGVTETVYTHFELPTKLEAINKI